MAADAAGGARERPLRVLVSGVVLGQPMGGVLRHNAELLPRVAERLARAGGGLAVLEGVPAAAIPLPPPIERIASDVRAWPAALRGLAEGRALERALRDAAGTGRPFDLVHTAHLPAPRNLSVPYVLTVHDLRSFADDAPRARALVARRLTRAAVIGARAVVTVSESVRAELVRRFDIDPERVGIVPNAADHLTPLPRNPAPDAPLLVVGHLEPRKNQELVLRALAHDPTLPDLVLAGAAKGGERARLEHLARELGLAARVRFLGRFDDADLPRLYATSAAVVVPSRIEGFGIPALEARRARAPLAVAAIPALLEVAGRATPSFPPSDEGDEGDEPAACAAAIWRALATPADALERVGRHADQSTWDRSADALLALWRRATLPPHAGA